MTQEQIQNTTALEWLTPAAKALLYYALKSLSTEAERFVWANHINPIDYPNELKEFHKNVITECTLFQHTLEQSTEPTQLNLHSHFK